MIPGEFLTFPAYAGVIGKAGRMMIQFIPVQGGSHAFPESSCDPSGCLSTGKGSGCVIAVGSNHVCVLSFEDGLGGGDETGIRIAAAAAGCGILMPEIEDGVVRMRAAHGGLLRVGRDAVVEIHSLGGMRIDILAHGLPVVKNQLVAEIWFEPGQVGTAGLSRAEEICHRCHPVIDVLPFRESKVGILIVSRHGIVPALLEILASLRRRIAELGSLVVGELTLNGEMDAETVVRWLSESGADMLVMVGTPAPGEKDWLADRFVTPSGQSTTLGQISLMPVFREGKSDPVPVLRLSGQILEDRGLVAEILIPRFLAGVHANPEEDGREYDRAGNFPRLFRG